MKRAAAGLLLGMMVFLAGCSPSLPAAGSTRRSTPSTPSGPATETGLPSQRTNFTPSPSPSPSREADFPGGMIPTPFPGTAPARNTLTPTFPPGSLTPQPSYKPRATTSDQQVFVDPRGWYAVNLPADWWQVVEGRSYQGWDGFFETGYLPEMAYMDHALDICLWWANIRTPNVYSVSWMGSVKGSCQLTSRPGAAAPAVIEIIPNPSADPEHRYFYLKTDPDHFDRLLISFRWLRPVEEKTRLQAPTGLVRPQDRAFWMKTGPPPAGVTVEEYPLPPRAQDENPADKMFLDFIPPEAPPLIWPEGKDEDEENDQQSAEDMLAQFGYQLQPGEEEHFQKLVRNDRVILDQILRINHLKAFQTSSGVKLILLVHRVDDPEQPFYAEGNSALYLVQNESVTLWKDGPPSPMEPGFSPILVGEQVLWLQLGEDIVLEVKNSRGQVLDAFAAYFGTHVPVRRFSAWQGGWILAVSDFVVHSGETLNERYGFEQVFNWHLQGEKPVYFFRKGPRVGLAYQDTFLPVHYHRVVHGYCCGLALNNPIILEGEIRFFGLRDGIWYYVVVRFPSPTAGEGG